MYLFIESQYLESYEFGNHMPLPKQSLLKTVLIRGIIFMNWVKKTRGLTTVKCSKATTTTWPAVSLFECGNSKYDIAIG